MVLIWTLSDLSVLAARFADLYIYVVYSAPPRYIDLLPSLDSYRLLPRFRADPSVHTRKRKPNLARTPTPLEEFDGPFFPQYPPFSLFR